MNLTKQEIETLKIILSNNPGNKACEKLLKKLSKPPIKISSRKAKGRNLQKWVCERIAKIFNIEYDQSDDQCLIHSREMGQKGTDIILRGEVNKLFPFDVECKAQESIQLKPWIEQAKANISSEEKSWLLVIKNQSIGIEPIVVMDWGAFESLIIIRRIKTEISIKAKGIDSLFL